MNRGSIFLHLNSLSVHNDIRFFTTKLSKLCLDHRLAKHPYDDTDYSTAKESVVKEVQSNVKKKEITSNREIKADSTLSIAAFDKYFGNSGQKTFYVDESKEKSNHRTDNAYWKRIILPLEQILHVDEVRLAQARVIDIKNQLHDAGNKKRAVQRKVVELQQEQSKLYKDFKTNRSSTEYLELIKKEFNLCKQIDELQKELAVVDEQEQYLFNAFSVAINDSYEKEKIHSNMIKVLGILGTLVGSFITFVLSVVGLLYNQKKLYTLRKDVEDSITHQVLQKLDKVSKDIKEHQQRILNEVKPRLPEKPSESWGSYLHRHTRWIYSWAIPKKS